MQAVADQDQVGERFLAITLRTMAVMPVQELLQCEEHREACEDQTENGLLAHASR